MRKYFQNLNWNRFDQGGLRITAIYLLVGGLWILFSDRLVSNLVRGNTDLQTQISIYKGWGYVLVTGFMLYLLIQNNTRTLREAREKYRSIFEGAVDGIFQATPDGRFLTANPALANMLGYASPAELTDSPSNLAQNVYVQTEKRDELLKLLREQGDVRGFEFEARRKDGGKTWVSLNAHVVRSRQGKMLYYEGTIEGINERILAERQAAQMQRLYATLSQVNQTIVRVKSRVELFQSICDVAVKFGKFTLAWIGLLDETSGDVQPAAVSGLDAQQWPFGRINIHSASDQNGLVGKAITTSQLAVSDDIQHDRQMRELAEKLQRSDFHSSASIPIQFQGKTIGLLSLTSSEAGFFNAEEERLLLQEMGLDISFALDMIETEKLRRQWADAFENCAHGLDLVLPGANRILTCNPAFARLQGRSIEEVTSLTSLDLYAPQDRERVKQYIAEADRTGRVSYEAHMQRKDGSLYPVQMDIVSVRDEVGNLLYRVATQQDITERRQAEEKLRLENERFLRFMDSNIVGILIADPAGKVIQANDYYLNLLGVVRQDLFEGRVDWRKVTPPEWLPADEKAIRELRERGICEPYEKEYVRADGSRVSVYLADAMLPGPDNQIAAFALDITERKRTEKALRESEEKFRKAFMTSPDAVNINRLDDGLYVLLNHGFTQILGYTETDAIGKTSLELGIWVDPEDRKRLVDGITRDGFINNLEARFRKKDGSTAFGLMSAAVIELDGVPHILSVTHDITERKQAENELRHQKELLQSIVDNIPVMIAYIDPTGRTQWVNRQWEQVLGWSLEEAASQDILTQMYPDPQARQQVLNLAAGGAWNDFATQTKDGRVIETSWANVTLSDGTSIGIGQDITERKRAEQNIRLQFQRITALNMIDRAINSSLDIRLSLDILLNEVLVQLGVDAAAVLLLETASQTLDYITGKGFRTSRIAQSRVRLGEEGAGRVGLERTVLHIPNPTTAEHPFKRAAMLREEGFVEYIGIPLVAKGMLKGVLEIFHRSPLDPDPEWLNYLETLGGQAAIAIDNAQLFEGMQQANLELTVAYDATIAGWSHAMDLRDKETEGHTLRVSELTLKLAEKMGLHPDTLTHIRRGALLHDVGKLGVPDGILLKPGPLTNEEWVIMRQHPTYALNMLLPIAYLRPALDIPYCHHERWNGAGYPRGLKGEEIPLAARLFAVVDVWDALTSDRPYRPAWSRERVLDYIQAESGKSFDPSVVTIFLKMLEENGE